MYEEGGGSVPAQVMLNALHSIPNLQNENIRSRTQISLWEDRISELEEGVKKACDSLEHFNLLTARQLRREYL